MRISLIGALASMVGACASIGRPEGGPRDETPPEYVRSVPEPGATNITGPKVNIYFNENVKLEDISNKLVVSPAQKQNPAVSANGRRVTVELRDTMLPNTTYTLDFSDAIQDLNEGNILDGFAMAFSTGDTIDTLSISGMVFEARNLEPAQGMVVGVTSNLSDTAITTLPLERVSKTNQYGQFTIRNLKPGTYNLFALDDRNHDWHWDRSENIAFSSVSISPSVEPVSVSDTLRASSGEDSIVVREAWRYLPDDVLLTWFNEQYSPQYLREYERTDRQRATFKFGAKSDTLPEITILNGPRAGKKLADISVIESRQGLDSLVYWIRDTLVTAQDSLFVSARYMKTDTLDRLVPTTDTLKLFVRAATRQAEKAKAKEIDELRKAQERKDKEAAKAKEKERRKNNGDNTADETAAEDTDTVPATPPVEITLLNIKPLTGAQQELHLPAVFEVERPVESIDSAGWRLEMQIDSVWAPVTDARLERDSAMIRRYNLTSAWQEGTRYRFTADSLAVTDIYGHRNKETTHEFTTKRLEDYGNIIFNITDMQMVPDSLPVIVELLDKSDAVMASVPVKDSEARFTFVTPETYYARAFIDANRNGEWDTGNMAAKLQPEEVFYYPKKITLRKNWDIDQDWALFENPVDAQKPNEIKKNKPKTRDKNARDDYGEEDEEYEDDEGFGANGFSDGNSWGNGAQYNNARRNSSQGNRRNRNSGLRQSRSF